MILGWFDITGKGHLTSQLCFIGSMISQFSGKKQLLITRNPEKAEHYLGIATDDAEKKKSDLYRLAVNGQLNAQLVADYSIPLSRNFDYLDVSFLNEMEENYREALYEYLLEKANEGYSYVFADMASEFRLLDRVDKIILCGNQTPLWSRKMAKLFKQEASALCCFGCYFPESKWTMNTLTKGVKFAAFIGIPFGYELFDAFEGGKILEYARRKHLLWEKEYKQFAKFMNGGEERRK